MKKAGGIFYAAKPLHSKRLNRSQKGRKKLGLDLQSLKYKVNFLSVKLGVVIDQTLKDAVSQIQIVLRKKKTGD